MCFAAKILFFKLFFSANAEGRGNLWLVAATGAALSIPYHLLLMSPTKPYIPTTSGVGAVDEVANGQLMYSPSGILVPAPAAAASWTKRYWFGAALSMASFGAMMAILASKRDMAAFVAPF